MDYNAFDPTPWVKKAIQIIYQVLLIPYQQFKALPSWVHITIIVILTLISLGLLYLAWRNRQSWRFVKC